MMLHSVDFALTRRCNLRCAFCYIEEKTSETPAGEVERNLNTVEWIVGQYRAGMDDIPAENRRIGIHPSIDGCQEAEDFFRRTEKGVPVSDTVFRNAKVLTGKMKGRSCRSTIAPETARWMLKSVRFLCEEIGFETVNQVLAGGVKWTDEALDVVRQQTVELTDWWIDCLRKGVHYSLYYMRNMLTGVWNPMRDRRLCSSGLSRAAIDTDGNIYPCHRFCNVSTPAEYKMGNIHEGGVINMELENKLKDFDVAAFHKDKCATCIAVNSCHALCLHEMMLQGKGMFEPLEHYCILWPFYYREAMRAHAILTAEQNQKYLQIYRPRPRAQNGQRGRRNGQRPAPGFEPAWEGFEVNSVTAAQWVPDPETPPRPAVNSTTGR